MHADKAKFKPVSRRGAKAQSCFLCAFAPLRELFLFAFHLCESDIYLWQKCISSRFPSRSSRLRGSIVFDAARSSTKVMLAKTRSQHVSISAAGWSGVSAELSAQCTAGRDGRGGLFASGR